MLNNGRYRYSPEVKGLTSGENGGQNFVLLRCRQNKLDIRWGFFQSFEKGIKGCRTQHMHLINNIHFVFTLRRWYTHLLYQGANIFYGIVGSSVELKNIIGTVDIKSLAGCTCIA